MINKNKSIIITGYIEINLHILFYLIVNKSEREICTIIIT